MACGSTIATTGSLVLSTAKGISDIREGKKRMAEGKANLSDLMGNRPDLTNVYAGMSVPTQGYELQAQGIQQQAANTAQNLAMAGSRGVIGGSSTLSSSTAQSMANLSAMFTQSLFNLQQMKAQDEARIQRMKEERSVNDIGYAQQEIAYGRQQRQAGYNTLIDTMASTGEFLDSQQQQAQSSLLSAGTGMPITGVSSVGGFTPSPSTASSFGGYVETSPLSKGGSIGDYNRKFGGSNYPTL